MCYKGTCCFKLDTQYQMVLLTSSRKQESWVCAAKVTLWHFSGLYQKLLLASQFGLWSSSEETTTPRPDFQYNPEIYWGVTLAAQIQNAF